MTKFSLKGIINEENFMIHIIKKLPEEYDVILDGLENHLMSSGPNALTIEMIHEN